MSKYGQYCPVARTLELIGDRWTLLIIRDMFFEARHFTDLERGLPGISRALLSARLQQLQKAGIITKQIHESGRNATTYQLTQAGLELYPVLNEMRVWGEAWAFGDPTPEELDPVLLMWRLRLLALMNPLPQQRVIVQFDFCLPRRVSFWLILACEDVTLCLTDPGYTLDLLVKADLASLYKLWGQRVRYAEIINSDKLQIEGTPALIRAFPGWFGWNAIVSGEMLEEAHPETTLA